MYAAPAGTALHAVGYGWHVMEVTGTAMLLGWIAERVLDTGIHIPGIGAAAGVCGYYFGAWLWDLTGWSDGPLIAGFPIVPTFAGALAVCGFLKLVGLAADHPRW